MVASGDEQFGIEGLTRFGKIEGHPSLVYFCFFFFFFFFNLYIYIYIYISLGHVTAHVAAYVAHK